MAFNPFEAFSLRSKFGKAVMAVLGIVVMLTFVLSSGAVGSKNDFVDQISGIFNSKKRGDVYAEAYGKKVYETDLQEIRRQRLVSAEFMNMATNQAYSNWVEELRQTAKGDRLKADTASLLTKFADARTGTGQQYMAFMQGPEMQRASSLISLAKPDSDDRKALEEMRSIAQHDQFSQFVPNMILADIGLEKSQDLLNFDLLLMKADQLGIRYSEEAVLELIGRETGGKLRQKDHTQIGAIIHKSGRYGEFDFNWIYKAIGNEFRARTVLLALKGDAGRFSFLRNETDLKPRLTASGLIGGLTPGEFFDFYKDQCSEHSFDAIEVSADKFLDQVKGEPTTKERIELFLKYRNDVADPAKEKPGFKEPRKIKVEFTPLDATAKRVTDAIPKIEAASLLLSMSAGALGFGGGPAPVLLQAAHPEIARTLPPKIRIEELRDRNLSRYFEFDAYSFEPRDTNIYRPQPIAALLAGFAGYPCPTAAVAPYMLMTQQVQEHYMKHQVPFVLQAWLMPFNPVATNVFGYPAFAYAHSPPLPPDGIYQPIVASNLKKDQRRQIFNSDVNEFRKKLSELNRDASPFLGKPDKDKVAKARAESRKFVAEWLAARGLTATGPAVARDQAGLVREPSLKPLNDKALPNPDGTNSFVEEMFATFGDDPRMPAEFRNMARTAPYQPMWFPNPPQGEDLDKPNNLFWITDDVPAESYKSLKAADDALAAFYSRGPIARYLPLAGYHAADMTARVDQAWRLEKARALAKAEADKLLEKVKEIGKTAKANPSGVEKQLLDLVAAQKFRIIKLDGLAKLKYEPGATQANVSYGPPKIDKSKVQYPSADFADKLLEIRNEPIGSATIVADAPKANYYVACLIDTSEKKVAEFKDKVFSKSNAVGAAQDPLYGSHALPQEQREADKAVFARLRAEAGVTETDAMTKSDERGGE